MLLHELVTLDPGQNSESHSRIVGRAT
jgi:hypothetical protein